MHVNLALRARLGGADAVETRFYIRTHAAKTPAEVE
jgi:hypothetical protein